MLSNLYFSAIWPITAKLRQNWRREAAHLPILQKAAAFTLIELSIVLVIIGLIVGGVLVGQDLIRAAELRSIYADKEKFLTAYNTFRLKYDCIAGDCINATQFFGTDTSCPNTPSNTTPKTATCNGNGDRKVVNSVAGSSIPSLRYEWFRFWQHLANAGLIEGKYTGVEGSISDWHTISGVNAPLGKISKNSYRVLWTGLTDTLHGTWFTYPEGHWLVVGTPNTSTGDINKPFLTPFEAKSLDNKYDDGMPATGNMRATKLNNIWGPNCTTSDNASTAQYNITVTELSCIFLIRF